MTVGVDFYYYGKVTWPALNILAYNAAGNGDELYGVEEKYYYLKVRPVSAPYLGPLSRPPI